MQQRIASAERHSTHPPSPKCRDKRIDAGNVEVGLVPPRPLCTVRAPRGTSKSYVKMNRNRAGRRPTLAEPAEAAADIVGRKATGRTTQQVLVCGEESHSRLLHGESPRQQP